MTSLNDYNIPIRFGEIKLLIEWFKQEKKKLENEKEETDEG